MIYSIKVDFATSVEASEGNEEADIVEENVPKGQNIINYKTLFGAKSIGTSSDVEVAVDQQAAGPSSSLKDAGEFTASSQPSPPVHHSTPKFYPEDDLLLVDLKEKKNLTWEQISDFFPSHSVHDLQHRYADKQKNLSSQSYTGQPPRQGPGRIRNMREHGQIYFDREPDSVNYTQIDHLDNEINSSANPPYPSVVERNRLGAIVRPWADLTPSEPPTSNDAMPRLYARAKDIETASFAATIEATVRPRRLNESDLSNIGAAPGVTKATEPVDHLKKSKDGQKDRQRRLSFSENVLPKRAPSIPVVQKGKERLEQEDRGEIVDSPRAERSVYGDIPSTGSMMYSPLPAVPSNPISSHLLNQFPNRVPSQFAVPYVPGISHADSFGAAAEYYGDTGESVQHQPGVRPQQPSVIMPLDTPHLVAASSTANPVKDTGSGAAAEFYGSSNTDTTPAVPGAFVDEGPTPPKPDYSGAERRRSSKEPYQGGVSSGVIDPEWDYDEHDNFDDESELITRQTWRSLQANRELKESQRLETLRQQAEEGWRLELERSSLDREERQRLEHQQTKLDD